AGRAIAAVLASCLVLAACNALLGKDDFQYVSCLGDADCIAPTPHCNTATHTCVPDFASPPPPGPTMPPDGTTDTIIALDHVFIGDTDPDGTPDILFGWQYYGYNLDHRDPSDLSTFCQPVNRMSREIVHQEGMVPGHVGVENAFGRLVIPALLTLIPNASGL